MGFAGIVFLKESWIHRISNSHLGGIRFIHWGYSWGVALAKHGDLDGAVAKFKDANQKAPHWADPLKAWGDVLVKQGKIDEARAKYDEALEYAPAWKDLKMARAAAAKL